jgi:phosphoglycolate phosphatase-like HAD superfamily hydrolase
VINNNIDDFVSVVSDMFEASGGHRITKRELRQKWTQPYMKFFKLYFPKYTIEEQRELYQRYILKYKKRDIYPGAYKVLKRLKALEFKMYILSGDTATTIHDEIDEYRLSGFFKKVVFNVHDKTDDLIKLIKDERLDPKKTAFIGDTLHEIECSRAAGTKSIAVTWGMNCVRRLEQAKPDYLVHSFKQLEKIIIP